MPRWLVRQLRHRDGGCRFPGCGRTRWVHAHHIVFRGAGGPTTLDNLVLLCGHHHRVVHDQGWRLSGHPAATLHFPGPTAASSPPGPHPSGPTSTTASSAPTHHDAGPPPDDPWEALTGWLDSASARS